MHFGEYELSPSLISLSPLPSAHWKAFQRLPIRSSSWCYPTFNLAKGRSLGFASTPPDLAPCSDSLSLRLRRDGPRCFTQDFSCPALLRIPLGFVRESCTGLSPSMADFSKAFHFPSFLPRRGPTTPVSPRRHGFGLFRVRSPLLTESLFIFSSYGYLDVSVPHVRLPFGMTGLQPAGLPHSDIPGSTAICASPGLFAAYHVLRRLREPRHPPSALAYFLSPRT